MFNKKKIVFVVLITMLAATLIVGCGGEENSSNGEGNGSGKTFEFDLAHTGGPDSAVEKTYEKFKELVDEKTDGNVEITLHGAGSLAGDQSAVEGAQRGTIDIGSSGTNNMAPFTNQFLFSDLPYVFNSVEHAQKVWTGEIGETLKESVGEELGIKGLFYVDVGSFRVIGNNEHPVKSPEDMEDLRLRATASPIEKEIIEAWGADASPIDWSETYSALEQGVVDGTYVQHMWTTSAKHHEAMDYYTEAGGVYNVHFCFMNTDAWEGLPSEYQDAVTEAAKEAEEYGFDIAPELVDGLREEMKEEGGEFYEPTEEEMEQFISIRDEVWEEFEDDVDQEILQKAVEAEKK